MSEAPIIRPAVSTDAEQITAFNSAMALETEHIELCAERALAGVHSLLADSSKGFYLLAELDGRVVGQLMVTYEWSDWRNGTFWWIQSVYVAPDFRGRGIFRQLYEDVVMRARNAEGVCGLRLYVESENRAAQQTYEKIGMSRTGYVVYEVDYVIPKREPSSSAR